MRLHRPKEKKSCRSWPKFFTLVSVILVIFIVQHAHSSIRKKVFGRKSFVEKVQFSKEAPHDLRNAPISFRRRLNHSFAGVSNLPRTYFPATSTVGLQSPPGLHFQSKQIVKDTETNPAEEARSQWRARCTLIDIDFGSIPFTIHQSWRSAERIPARFRTWIRSWVTFNPGWRYVFWDDFDNRMLIHAFFPEFRGAFDALGRGVAQADFCRYAIMHLFGGLYVDMDFECKAPFRSLVSRFEGFLSSEPQIHAKLLEKREGVFVCNAILASRPGHPFWLAVMDSIRAAVQAGQHEDPVSLTGPRRIHKVFQENASARSGIKLLPEDYFYPEVAKWNIANLERACIIITTFNQRECQQLREHPNGMYTNNTHAVHHWECTWCRGDRSDSYLPITSLLEGHLVLRPFNRSKPHPAFTSLV
eukprot:GGOE01013631.1.p1 GENE.GGOE01013631.1~~GGOE01013631.1.p1  ORF type:complete len:417 (-),score=22.98 GGOE01013631.1:70-1320(-)